MHSRLANGIHQDSTSATESCRRSETSVHRSVEFLHEPLEYDFSSMSSTSCFNIGVISGLVYTVKTTGFLSLYNGLGVTLVGSIPKAGIRFGGNAYCKKLLADDKGKLNMAQQFLAGMGAGTIEAILAVTPMETIKTKLIEVSPLWTTP